MLIYRVRFIPRVGTESSRENLSASVLETGVMNSFSRIAEVARR